MITAAASEAARFAAVLTSARLCFCLECLCAAALL